MCAIVGIARVTRCGMGPEGNLGDRLHEVAGDHDPTIVELCGRYDLFHGSDDGLGRTCKVLIQNVRLLHKQIAESITYWRMDDGHIRLKRRNSNKHLTGERTGRLRILRVQAAHIRSLDSTNRQERQAHFSGP